MKILILGTDGQLGSEFKTFLKDKVEVFAFSHKELDILDFKNLVSKFKEILPDIVINCAAYTKVDQAEKEENFVYQVNAIGAKNVGLQIKIYGSLLIRL